MLFEGTQFKPRWYLRSCFLESEIGNSERWILKKVFSGEGECGKQVAMGQEASQESGYNFLLRLLPLAQGNPQAGATSSQHAQQLGTGAFNLVMGTWWGSNIMHFIPPLTLPRDFARSSLHPGTISSRF